MTTEPKYCPYCGKDTLSLTDNGRDIEEYDESSVVTATQGQDGELHLLGYCDEYTCSSCGNTLFIS